MISFKRQISLLLLVFSITIFQTGEVSAENYSIHVASYKTVSHAQADINRLRSKGYAPVFVSEAEVPGSGKWYRVYAGKYENKQQASLAGAEMKRKQEIDKIFIHRLPDAKSETKIKKVRQDSPSKEIPADKRIVVVGNKTSKRYHLPGMPFYNKVKSYHRILFQSEKEAIDKGYYKAGTESDVIRPRITQRTSKKENIGSVPDRKPYDDREGKKTEERKEAFKALMMGNEKLMPPPLKVVNTEKSEDDFKEPDEKNIIEPPSNSILYNKALNELKEKRYKQALITFNEFITRNDTNKEWGQRALRHMADCHYFLGKEGSKENLLIAAEFYKNTLASFPDPRKENALTYYRLAKTYDQMKYYPEAIKHYQNLIAKYPEAPYVPEAYYNIGEDYYKDGKYNQASEAFIRYLMKYHGGVNAKKSYYLIAHSFYKAKQSTNAEVWFRDAQKKWPNFSSMPKELVLDYGFHKMALRRFDEAVSAFSFYVNMYPNDDKIIAILKMLANSYQQAGQFAPALAVYDRIIEKYPNTKEADESMLAMASMGVDKPGVKVFRFMNHLHYYRYPIDTYDTLILKNPEGDIGEEAMLQKAYAFVRKGQGRKAADIYIDFLQQYPQSKRVADATIGLKKAAGALIDEYYDKKDYLAVAYVYFKSYRIVTLRANEYPQVSKIAFSLKELGFIDDYLTILNRYLKVAVDESIINKVTLDIADGLINQGKYDEAQTKLNELAFKPSVKKSVMMTEIRKNLAEIAYRRQQYDQAVVNYDAVLRSGQEISDPGTIYAKYARSLNERQENTQALQNYLLAAKYLKEEKQKKVSAGITYKEIGDLYLKSNNLAGGLDMYNKALASTTDKELKFWSQFLVGETYLRMNKDDQAQNTFAQIKIDSGPEGFWTKVVDFYQSDAKWWEKYGGKVKK